MIVFVKIFLLYFLFSTSYTEDFISIKEITNIANLRKGPGAWYPVKWIIKTPSLPLKVLEKGDSYNKVELHDGTVGWLSIILTTDKKNLIVTSDTLLADGKGNTKARVLKDFIIKSYDCELEKKPKLCKVELNNLKGFISKHTLWGF